MSDEKTTQPLHVTDDNRSFDEARRDEPSVATPPEREARPLVRTGPRTGTVVWGFLVMAVGVGVLAQAAGARIDVELAAIVLLGVAGALLVLGSVVSGVRRRRDETRA
ncbi:hypothetical protein [Isoptericola variabilis]|uniref:Uncharacterized protein n=1 Tax=Isoptericola variabilis (strain 225) TaxID=743718 RepID=F6FWV8_ISOV2|nr:hypothetical protein [Isoptericola variabilis]AEG43530.1 hypothetical protein Isova_0744 [Isoptericola variabilis 225]TWH32103.1 hypothetical protein L600_000200001270 [Isoptericola variabilis J7]